MQILVDFVNSHMIVVLGDCQSMGNRGSLDITKTSFCSAVDNFMLDEVLVFACVF